MGRKGLKDSMRTVLQKQSQQRANLSRPRLTPLLLSTVLLLSAFALNACKEVQPRPKAASAETGTAQTAVQALNAEYVLDGSGSLFENMSWYTYQSTNHVIWSHLDVFAVKVGSNVFNLQVLAYQHPENPSQKGYYTVRYNDESKSSATQEIEFDASACGNPFSNPDYGDCFKDPNRNVFTYLNLNTLKTWRMTDAKAKTDQSWHIAFKKTTIKFNAGTDGPGNVLAGLRYRDYSLLNPDLTGNIKKLREALQNDKGQSRFQAAQAVQQYTLRPPKGESRMIYEKYWYGFNSRSNQREAKPQYWWIIRNAENNSYTRFSVSSIEQSAPQTPGAVNRESRFTFSYDLQTATDATFTNNFQSWTFRHQDDANNTSNAQTYCFDFASRSVVDCATEANRWDFQLKIGPAPEHAWEIYTNNGSFGPLSRAQMEDIPSGRLK